MGFNASGDFLYDVAGMYVSPVRGDLILGLNDATLDKQSGLESD